MSSIVNINGTEIKEKNDEPNQIRITSREFCKYIDRVFCCANKSDFSVPYV